MKIFLKYADGSIHIDMYYKDMYTIYCCYLLSYYHKKRRKKKKYTKRDLAHAHGVQFNYRMHKKKKVAQHEKLTHAQEPTHTTLPILHV